MRWREGRLASLPGFAEAPSEAEGEVEGSRRAGKPGSPPVSLDRQPSRGARFSDIFGRRILINSAEVCILRTSLVIVSFSLALFVPLFAHAAGQTLEARRAELNRLLADEWEYTLRTQPELATQVGDDRYNDRLSGFPEQEKLNHSLMLRSLREALDAAQFKDWEMPATQFGGIHLGYASLAFDSPFRNVKDYEDYLSRLRQ